MSDSGSFIPLPPPPGAATQFSPAPSGQVYVRPGNASRTDSAAVMAFLLALMSFVAWVLPAIVAFFLARKSKQGIRKSDGALTGYRLATAAQVLAILSILITAVVIAVLLPW